MSEKISFYATGASENGFVHKMKSISLTNENGVEYYKHRYMELRNERGRVTERKSTESCDWWNAVRKLQ